ncbi:conserved hypothetical protein [Xenorhabdus bovienii str. feltiae Florida]|nr:conserved hypothetical protein [Xenorhabdus bovienii str. feltiae Florida]
MLRLICESKEYWYLYIYIFIYLYIYY